MKLRIDAMADSNMCIDAELAISSYQWFLFGMHENRNCFDKSWIQFWYHLHCRDCRLVLSRPAISCFWISVRFWLECRDV